MVAEAASNAVNTGAGWLKTAIKWTVPALALTGAFVAVGALAGGGSAAFTAAAASGTEVGLGDIALTGVEGIQEAASGVAEGAQWVAGNIGAAGTELTSQAAAAPGAEFTLDNA